MRIRFLGPLEAVGEADQAVPLGGPKQRLVFAHLLVQANQVVPSERLIDAVWGETPPPAARATLQSYVSHLRKALGAQRIESRGAGYRLRVEADEVDGLRFEALTAGARQLLDDDPAAADARLAEALALWHGPPFADLAGEPSLEREVASWEARHTQAAEDRMAAELARGGGGELVAELEALVTAHPLRERLWGQLMLALYRSGRQAEALAAFERARERLAEELGVDPSSELQWLHTQILRQDAALQPGAAVLRGYRLLERIGEGPHGVVWRAVQPGVEREVAVKVLHAALADQPEFIRRFDSEAQVVARVEHRHVVPLYDYWREPGGAYLVMRLMRGSSLRALLDRAGPPQPDAALRTVEQVAGALAEAHRRGVAHGDVKLSNILFDEEGSAYLSDFGIATEGTRPAAGGVTAYLSPERRRGEPATPAADVYALGVVLAELLPDPGAAARSVIDRATAADPAARYPDAAALRDALPDAPSAAPASRPAAAVAPTVRNPYKGLRAFVEADAGDFFGREALVGRLLTRLRQDGPAGRFVALVGPSGSGKSSVVRAGLIPALRAGALPGSASWFVAQMTPGAAPLADLAAALRGVVVDPPVTLAAALEAGTEDLAGTARRLLPEETGELLVVVDQFEELFTLVADEEQRRRFLRLLAAAVADPAGRVRVVATLRADFYDRPLLYPECAPLFSAGLCTATPLTADELERAVTAPAAQVEVGVEPGLVARLVADVADQPGALPLVQYALTELFDRRDDATLTLAAYQRIGGVSGALARRAEELHAGLDAAAQQAARQLLLRLVTLGEGAEDTRRRVTRSELSSLHDDAAPMDAVLDAFGRARLLSFDRDPHSRAPTVELAHEALIREWGRLRAWVDAARDDLRTQRRLAAAAGDWADAAGDPSFLAAGSRLEQFAALGQRDGVALAAEERAFLEASLAERDRREAEEEARRTHEDALERRAWRRLRALVAVFAIAAVIAGGLTVVALRQSARLDDQVRLTTARELAAAAIANLDVDPDRAILLALEAVEATFAGDGTVVREAEEALHHAVRSSRLVYTLPHGINLAVSSDGARFATNGEGEIALIRDTATGATLLTLTGHERRVTGLAFSPDDTLLATTGFDGTLRVWDTTGGRALHVLEGAAEFAAGPAFSPDGRFVAATGSDGAVRIWDVTTGAQEQVLGGHPSESWWLGFSPDGSRIAAGGDVVTVFDLASGEATLTLTDFAWGVPQVIWSHDGSRLVTASLDGTARVWDAVSGAEVDALPPHPSALLTVALSSDGSRLATGGWDATVRVWDLETRHELLTLGGHTTDVTAVAFTPDGDRLLSASFDGTTRLWDVSPTGARSWLTVQSPAMRYAGVTFSPDGDTFAVPRQEAGVILHDTATGEIAGVLEGHDATIVRTAFSPDGRLLAGVAGSSATPSDADHTVPVWDLETGRLRHTLTGHEDQVGAVAFSPDGRRLGTGADDGTVRVWDITTGALGATLWPGRDAPEPAPDLPADWFPSLAFSPDGRVIVSGDGAGRLTVFDAETLTESYTLDAHDFSFFGLAFAADGRLVTASSDGSAKVWDVDYGEEVAAFLAGDLPLNTAAFSPDGTRVAVGAEDGSVRLWDPETGQELLAIHGHDVLV